MSFFFYYFETMWSHPLLVLAAVLLACIGGAPGAEPGTEDAYAAVVGVVSPGGERLTAESVRSLFNTLEKRVQCGGVSCGKVRCLLRFCARGCSSRVRLAVVGRGPTVSLPHAPVAHHAQLLKSARTIPALK